MGRVEVQRTIAAPCERVFELIANGDNAPQWHLSVVSAHHETAPPIRVGSRLRVQAEVGRRSYAWTQEVTAWEPPRVFRDRLVPGEGPFHRFEDWGQFEPTAAGTRVTFGVDYALRGGPLGWLIDRLVLHRRLRPQMESSLAKAASLVER